MKIVHSVDFNKLISLESLFENWSEFRKGKGKKIDVMVFERNLEDNLFALHRELASGTYRHGGYTTFHIFDPMHRVISKAAVKDRLVHHIVFNKLYEIFDSNFIYHSYSSRRGKGTHLAVRNLAQSLRAVSRNYTRPTFALKCDIRKFFDSVSHKRLLQLIENKIKNSRFLWLVRGIIQSFSVDKIGQGGGFTWIAYR